MLPSIDTITPSVGNAAIAPFSGAIERHVEWQIDQYTTGTGCQVESRVVVNVFNTAWASARASARQLLGYASASADALMGQAHCSMAFDKSQVFGCAVANGALVLPDNRAFWLFPQVVLVYLVGGVLSDRQPLCVS